MHDERKYKVERNCPDCYTREHNRQRCPKCIASLHEHLQMNGFKLKTPKHNGRAGGRVVVFVANRPYAGFNSPEEAGEAVALWNVYWPVAKEYPIRIDGK
jgi:hypothetical protein